LESIRFLAFSRIGEPDLRALATVFSLFVCAGLAIFLPAMIVCIIVLPFSAAPARPFERVSASGARIFWLVVLLMFGVVIVWMALRLLLELLLLPYKITHPIETEDALQRTLWITGSAL